MTQYHRTTMPVPTGTPATSYAEQCAAFEAYLTQSPDDPAARERLAMLKAIMEEIVEQAGEGTP